MGVKASLILICTEINSKEILYKYIRYEYKRLSEFSLQKISDNGLS